MYICVSYDITELVSKPFITTCIEQNLFLKAVLELDLAVFWQIILHVQVVWYFYAEERKR